MQARQKLGILMCKTVFILKTFIAPEEILSKK